MATETVSRDGVVATLEDLDSLPFSVSLIRPRIDSAAERDELELAAHLMGQAVKAAILLIADEEQPQLAMEALMLARDRWASVWPHGEVPS